MYWILMSERTDEYELSIDAVPPALDALNLNFDYGIHIPAKLPVIDVPYSQHPEERKTDNIVAPTRLGLLVNAKVQAVFNSLDIGNIQYFPARLLEANSHTEDESYCIANIVGKLACVDKAESELDLFDDGEIEFIDKLTLDLDPDTDYGHIFRLAEFPPILVISDLLKTKIEDAKLTGFKIYKPEEFSL